MGRGHALPGPTTPESLSLPPLFPNQTGLLTTDPTRVDQLDLLETNCQFSCHVVVSLIKKKKLTIGPKKKTSFPAFFMLKMLLEIGVYSSDQSIHV